MSAAALLYLLAALILGAAGIAAIAVYRNPAFTALTRMETQSLEAGDAP